MSRNFLRNFLVIAVACLFLGCGPILKSTQGNADSIQQPAARIGYYLPKGIIRLQCKPKEKDSNNYEVTFEIKYVPDYNKYFTIEYCPSKAADDKINITQENGLLTMVDTTTTDQWVEIVKKLATIPKEIVKATALVPGTTLKELTTDKQVVVDVDIDPDLFLYNENEKKKKDLLDELKEYGLEVDLKSLVSRKSQIDERITTEGDYGIYYRLPLPYVLTVKFASKSPGTEGKQGDASIPPVATTPAKKSQKKAAKPGAPKSAAPKTSGEEKPPQKAEQPGKEIKYLTRQIFYLPNGGPILSLDVTRAEFVEKKTTINFNKGMLTGINQSKPSEILAGLNIPLEVIKAFVSLPTDLIQLKINYSKADTLLLQQQINEMRARDAIIDYIKQRSSEPTKEGAQRKDAGG